MEILSDKYGWTPKQIRELTLQEIEDYLEIQRMKNQVQEEDAKRQRRR